MINLLHLIQTYVSDQVEMSRTYGKTEWREDLKTLLKKSSTPDLHMVFLFIESQVSIRPTARVLIS